MATNTTRIAALETRMDAIDGKLDRLLAVMEADAPARTVTPRTRKAPAKKAPAKVTCLVKSNRRAFVEAHAWAAGLSTLDIAIAVSLGAELEAGWAIGEGYTAKAATATRSAKAAVRKALA